MADYVDVDLSQEDASEIILALRRDADRLYDSGQGEAGRRLSALAERFDRAKISGGSLVAMDAEQRKLIRELVREQIESVASARDDLHPEGVADRTLRDFADRLTDVLTVLEEME